MRKKLPLTGIAVLLLSAGAVQAREGWWLEGWHYAGVLRSSNKK
jgi:hypothetical protein